MKYAITSDICAHEPHVVAFCTEAQRLTHIARHGGRCISHREVRYGLLGYRMEPYEVRILSMDELYMAYRRAYCY